MEPFDEDIDKRKQKDSFDISTEDEFERISSEIQEMFKSIHFIEMLEEIHRDKFRANKWFINNFNINIRFIEKQKIQRSNSHLLKITQEASTESKDDKSTFDIITGDNEVAITLEIPDVEKEDIDLRVTRDSMEIMATKPMGEYYRFINLPCNVKSKTARATYRNGVLDIMAEKENRARKGVNKIEK